jgi:hypothetical protein
VPAVPFLFLLVAGALLRMPRWLAIVVGVVGTYWSWCLAMYRDVELGLGVFESLIHVTLEGPRLPWLVTLERLGYVAAVPVSTLVLIVAAALIWVLWTIRLALIDRWPERLAPILPLRTNRNAARVAPSEDRRYV